MNAPTRRRSPFFLKTISLLLLINMVWACKNGPKVVSSASASGEESTLTASNPRLVLHPGDETGLDFTNFIEESFESNPTNNINIYNGGGVAIGDFNHDNRPDIYFISCNGPNKLFLNEGNFKFKDATAGSGLESPDGFETAATAVDINNDGWLDLYVCRAGPYSPDSCRNRLFVNNQNGTFSEKSKEYGLDVETRSTGANFFDYDGDGDLDVFILNYPQSFNHTSQLTSHTDATTGKNVSDIRPFTPLDSHRLYENEGNGHFKNVSEKAGISTLGYGLSVTVSDFNGDHWPDIYVGNDFIQPDLLYINQRNGTFKNEISNYLKHSSQHTMGVDISDFDNDGRVDLTSVDMLPHERSRVKSTLNTNSQTRQNQITNNGYFQPVVRNTLQHNNGNGSFSDLACMAGMYRTEWSWSTLFMDLDNDGLKDIGTTNGYRREVTDMDFINFTFAELKKQKLKDQFPNVQEFLKLIPTFKVRNFLFKNKGDFTFEDMSGKWATMPPSFSNGAAYADFDGDGDLDWVISNIVDKPFLYENKTRELPNSNFLELKLVGSPLNDFAIGATATIFTAGNQLQYQEMNPTRGIFSSVEHLLHFGLADKTTVDKLVVRWPDGKTTTLQNVAANQILTLKWAEANGKDSPTAPAQPTIFKNTTAASGVNFVQKENDYEDFDAQFLIPFKYSELGPALASGDVNGDGLDDFFVGNGFDSPAALFVQNANGSFRRSSQPIWETDKIYEDAGAIFFDADGDHDLDLFVASGGYEATSPAAWQPRLYLNDGKGNFSKKTDALPTLTSVFQRVAAFDFDGDGDLDLFVGGRVKPRFPETPRSAVLKNEGGGKFSDATKTVGGDFENCGMVTGLAWQNVDSDPQPELVVVGEWMPVSIFKLDGGRLKNVTKNFGLENSTGLWQSLAVADLDGDGDLDLATGNFGLNTRLQASVEHPMHLFAKDFDGNGSIDPIVAMFEPDGKLYPIARQDMVVKQMPSLKKRFLYARDYGNATFEDVFTSEQRKNMLDLTATSLASTWWENQGGKFVAHVLPLPAQLSPALSTTAADFDGDGKIDLFLAGNKYGVEVETGRCDAGIGCLLGGDGKGGFQLIPNILSGIWANREARDVAVLRSSNGRKTVVVANNSDAVQVFSK